MQLLVDAFHHAYPRPMQEVSLNSRNHKRVRYILCLELTKVGRMCPRVKHENNLACVAALGNQVGLAMYLLVNLTQAVIWYKL